MTMLKRLNSRTLLIALVAGFLFVNGFQMIDHLFFDTPLRFDLVTLLILPVVFSLLVLVYWVVTGRFLPRLADRSPFWTGFRVRWVEYTILFLLALAIIDLSDIILEEKTWGVVNLVTTVVASIFGGALVAWLAPEKGIADSDRSVGEDSVG